MISYTFLFSSVNIWNQWVNVISLSQQLFLWMPVDFQSSCIQTEWKKSTSLINYFYRCKLVGRKRWGTELFTFYLTIHNLAYLVDIAVLISAVWCCHNLEGRTSKSDNNIIAGRLFILSLSVTIPMSMQWSVILWPWNIYSFLSILDISYPLDHRIGMHRFLYSVCVGCCFCDQKTKVFISHNIIFTYSFSSI